MLPQAEECIHYQSSASRVDGRESRVTPVMRPSETRNHPLPPRSGARVVQVDGRGSERAAETRGFVGLVSMCDRSVTADSGETGRFDGAHG